MSTMEVRVQMGGELFTFSSGNCAVAWLSRFGELEQSADAVEVELNALKVDLNRGDETQIAEIFKCLLEARKNMSDLLSNHRSLVDEYKELTPGFLDLRIRELNGGLYKEVVDVAFDMLGEFFDFGNVGGVPVNVSVKMED